MAPASTASPKRATAATKRSTSAKKAAATRSSNRTAATRRRTVNSKQAQVRRTASAREAQARRAAKGTLSDVQQYAERAVLIPVGAVLVARDRVVDTVTDVVTSYSSPSKAQTQLRKFERRGATARNRLERDVKKTRTRVERELRQRRGRVERVVTRLDKRRDMTAKNVAAQAELASARAGNAVQSGITASTELANRVQETVLSRV